MQEMISLKNWVVIGATDDKSKFGYKILKKLKDKGYSVCGINPKYNEIEGIKIYNNINEIKENIDVANIIVNPNIAITMLEDIKNKGIKNVWFQPGSFNDEVLEKAKSLGLNIEASHCAFVELQ
ncbi:CoA-binding protein [Clostridium ihumii]|uniref:CoA-binding protein n=1 Tax=Clostridium ihumii TaxID=1470356 RepID=UPI00058BD013|nr:CoA-binding protein [Clostridium ihumii]